MKLRFSLFLIIFLFLLSLFFCNDVSAFTFTSQVNGEEYTLPDLSTLNPDYINFLDNGYIIRFYDNKFYLFVQTDSDAFFYTLDNGNTIRFSYGGSFARFSCSSPYTSWSENPYINDGLTSVGSIIYYNATIYSDAEKSNVFFHLPVTEQVTIPALETVEQIPMAIVTTLKILIPVGLVIFGIGLVIYIIKRMKFLDH